ncbi:chromosome segregation protein ScpA [Halothiobacillus diazotrophicus]|uniref:Segregation and condensation protein A n=1 Tax=Halothiobacillus diazotrophicus TaxID=1860122 RepID=A0A191ZJC6_9GAMM|nr:ScpA family protein [Halothiobacillus diazotrophicus]ANJ68006.1 chromosome segregation protein ScpA [Halothiobacillus diazotrophicus]
MALSNGSEALTARVLVDGQPLRQLPLDLYIPPDALSILLERFEGPLDLLLYLIRKQNLDILAIPVAEVTRQYLAYLALMESLKIELAAEYLLMAAWLAEIKSRLLLPTPPATDEEEAEDPRAALVERLLAYERLTHAAQWLDELPRVDRDWFDLSVAVDLPRSVTLPPEIGLPDLLSALRGLVRRGELTAVHEVRRETLSVRARMTDILGLLEEGNGVFLDQVYRPQEGRGGVAVSLVAVLELAKSAAIDFVQKAPFDPVWITGTSASGAATDTSITEEEA